MELLRIAAAAERLGIRRQSLYDWLDRNTDKVPVVEVFGTKAVDWQTLAKHRAEITRGKRLIVEN